MLGSGHATQAPHAGATPLVRTYIVLLATLAGTLLVIGLLVSALAWPRTPEGVVLGVALTLLTTAAFFLERRALILHWREHRTSSSFDEPAVFLALYLLPPFALVPMIAMSTALVQLVSRRAPIKAAFNVGAYSSAAGIAAGIAYLAARAGVTGLGAAAIGLASYTIFSNVLVAALFADLERRPLVRIFRERFLLATLVHATLGITLGVVLVALWKFNPYATLLVVPLGGLALSVVRLSGRADREIVVHRRLAEMSTQLAGTRSLDAVAERVLHTCGDLFLPGRVVLAVRHDAAQRSWSRDYEGGADPAASPLVAPLLDKDGRDIGSLTVQPTRRVRDAQRLADSHLIRVVAAQVAAAVENAWSLDEIARLKDEHAGIVENVPAGVARLDPDGRATQMNALMRKILGGADEKSPLEAWPALDATPTLRDALRGLHARQAFADLEWRNEGRSYLVSGTPLGRDGSAVVLFLDITGRREAEEALRAQSVTRPLVRRIILNLVGNFNASRQAITQMGRSLAREVEGGSPDDFTAAFRTMGLGNLRFDKRESAGFRFEGDDLLERRSASGQPTCHLALGFLEGAVGKLHAGDALGSEVRCQSQGHERCVFVVMPKTQGGGRL